MDSFDSLRLVMISGKGGVGKTTLSCGFARRWAQQFPDQAILLISTDPAHSLGDVLQMPIDDSPCAMADRSNLQVRSLDAETLLQAFKTRYGRVLELLVERGSFVEGADLAPVWDLSWPGLDELMGILEIQRLLRETAIDRIVVDMAPSGHTLNLFGLMDFLDGFLGALDLFQEKHRVVTESFTGRYSEDEADAFLLEMKADLISGRQLLQDIQQTACLTVAIAEPMSWLETQRLLASLEQLHIPTGGIFVNRILLDANSEQRDRQSEQRNLLSKFFTLAAAKPVFAIPDQIQEPIGGAALDRLMAQIVPAQSLEKFNEDSDISALRPEKMPPSFGDFVQEGRQLILVGGKGGVGKTTVSAAIAWGMAARHPNRSVRVISIDPAHSLGDALGQSLAHSPTAVTANLSAQEIDAETVLEQFREDYLWELADMMSGDAPTEGFSIAYGPAAWRQIVAQALPGIDEMLALIAVIELLESKAQDLIILDTAPTGHLLRFLEMPTAMGDWLAWIFKLWLKYQDVVGHAEFMGRLRTLRQRVVQAQKKLKDPQFTEFIGVLQAQSAIVSEAERLARSIHDLGIQQRFIVHNRFEPQQSLSAFSSQTIVRLPSLPRNIAAIEQVQMAAELLF